MKDQIQTIHIFKTTDAEQLKKAVTAKVEKLVNIRIEMQSKTA